MKGTVTHRQLVLDEQGHEKLRVPLLGPINDVLGQLRPKGGDELYVPYLFERYSAFGGRRQSVLGHAGNRKTQVAFLTAAKRAVKGHLDASIAPHLEGLQFAADGTVDVPDLASLAAWGLLEAIRRQPLRLYTCPTCRGKWLGPSDAESRYCQRRSPEHPSKDCRTRAYERRLAGNTAYSGYRREYKRLTEARRRGRLSELELQRWRDENSPGHWLPFAEWKANRQEDTDAKS